MPSEAVTQIDVVGTPWQIFGRGWIIAAILEGHVVGADTMDFGGFGRVAGKLKREDTACRVPKPPSLNLTSLVRRGNFRRRFGEYCGDSSWLERTSMLWAPMRWISAASEVMSVENRGLGEMMAGWFGNGRCCLSLLLSCCCCCCLC